MELDSQNPTKGLTLEGVEIQLDIEAKKTLVGRILTDKPLNRAAVKEILAQAWRLNEELKISLMGPNVFLFYIQEAKQAKKVLEDGPWVLVSKERSHKNVDFIKYERLQGFCYNCGLIGHDNKKCQKEQEMVIYNPSRPRYGPNLGVPQARSLAAIVTENARISKKKEGEASGMPEGMHSGPTSTDPSFGKNLCLQKQR
ncbi:Zinc finger, CCHC-type [Sesbania bispinosa]|nr:Zinc finger, CCHC-type [Sesbania bispinosa]